MLAFSFYETHLLLIVSTDPFADADKGAGEAVQDGLVHIRIQQRNGRKTLTTIQGLSAEYDLKKIVRHCKKVKENQNFPADFLLNRVVLDRNLPATAQWLSTLNTERCSNSKETSGRIFVNGWPKRVLPSLTSLKFTDFKELLLQLCIGYVEHRCL